MNSLNLEALPKTGQKELRDFYDFLVFKYSNKLVTKSKAEKNRPYALAKGEFDVPEDFNEPLPDNLLNEFYN
jgi:hypothetical protein